MALNASEIFWILALALSPEKNTTKMLFFCSSPEAGSWGGRMKGEGEGEEGQSVRGGVLGKEDEGQSEQGRVSRRAKCCCSGS